MFNCVSLIGELWTHLGCFVHFPSATERLNANVFAAAGSRNVTRNTPVFFLSSCCSIFQLAITALLPWKCTINSVELLKSAVEYLSMVLSCFPKLDYIVNLGLSRAASVCLGMASSWVILVLTESNVNIWQLSKQGRFHTVPDHPHAYPFSFFLSFSFLLFFAWGGSSTLGRLDLKFMWS